MNNNSESIYDLVTKLCEKYISNQPNRTSYPNKIAVKRIRSKCYEILLSKAQSENSIVDELDNNIDPTCHLLAWQFQLQNKYNLPQHAEDLRRCCDKLQDLNAFNNVTYTNIILLLLQLRRVPEADDHIMETTINKNYTEDFTANKSAFAYFEQSRFKLPEGGPFSKIQFDDEYFKLPSKKDVYASGRPPSPKNQTIKFRNESPPCNIWEMAAQGAPTEHRTWEGFGYPGASTEPPFLCESGPQTTAWLQNLSTSFGNLITGNYLGGGIMRKVISYKQFIKDVKYLLVGMETKTFVCNGVGELCLGPGICVQGISTTSVQSYCKDLLISSSCYRGLTTLCTPNPFTQRYVHNGYIFLELCESIKRYLSYYRVAALAIPDTARLLAFHEQTRLLREHITVLASVCKVGPFSESGQIPHGVALLNYLYQKVMSTANKDVIMVLYSILYPCCQVYFSRFLQQWILEGLVRDPYGEFFITGNPKYESTRGRTYWTRSYTLREDIVPDFLTDLREDILLCGKTMNLLKLCLPTSPLCLYMMDKRPDIVCCCVMAEQLSNLELNNQYYYLEATALSGPRISLSHVVTKLHEEDSMFLSMVAKKRAATLNRIECERKKEIEVQYENKQKQMMELKEQAAEAQRRKQHKLAQDLENELQSVEKEIRMQSLHNRIVQEERNSLIEYYNGLFEEADKRRKFFEKRTEDLRKAQLDPADSIKKSTNMKIRSELAALNTEPDVTENSLASSGSYASTHDELTASASDIFSLAESDDGTDQQEELISLDIINANTTENESDDNKRNYLSSLKNSETAQTNKDRVLGANDKSQTEKGNKDVILTDAQKNRMKVMSSEYETRLNCAHKDMLLEKAKKKPNINKKPPPVRKSVVKSALTEAQKNKLKITAMEYGDKDDTCIQIKQKPLTDAQKNKMKVLSSEYGDDNQNFNNKKLNVLIDKNSNLTDKRPLSLDFTKINNKENIDNKKPPPAQSILKSPKFELDRISPMSIDSTPHSASTTPSNNLLVMFDKIDNEDLQSYSATTTTASTSAYEAGFTFEIDKSKSYINFEQRVSAYNLATTSGHLSLNRNITAKDASGVSPNCLKLCLQQSIAIPLITQMKLVNNELLKYFIVNLHYLKHLNNLRNYFFLLDGEFGRNITEGLFEKLYDVNSPKELINYHTLQALVHKALDYSTKNQDDSVSLSFKINNMPKILNLGDPDVFECISLTYTANWPLNILLPSDTISKYDDVFKFLLKLHRISWILQNMFQNLKSLVKETDCAKSTLLMSPQYRQLHKCRHVMTHFIQTLQSYVVGEVVQSSWEIFEKNLETVTNFDQLYTLHTNYIKNILFMCLLNQKSAPLRKTLQKIFVVILKFYDYLRSRSWIVENDVYAHPNFQRLEDIFNNFEELTQYLFKVCQKVVKSGYQPHLMQLLDMLDVNNYYSDKIVDSQSRTSTNTTATTQ